MFIFSFFSFREFSLPALANRALAIILCAAAFTFPHSARADSPPALLLAQNYAGGVDLGEYWVSEKLDGVRARWDGANLISRNGNRFAAPAWFTANFPAAKLDGELWMGRGRFEQTVSVVRRAAPHDGWREVRFMVFDMPRAGGDFNARLRRMKTTVAAGWRTAHASASAPASPMPSAKPRRRRAPSSPSSTKAGPAPASRDSRCSGARGRRSKAAVRCGGRLESPFAVEQVGGVDSVVGGDG